MLFMDDKTWQFRKLKSHCGGHLFCSVAVLIFFRASEAREMNTRLEGEERVLKISPLTLKKWRLQPRLRTDKRVPHLKCPQVNVDISQIKFEFGMLVLGERKNQSFWRKTSLRT